MSDAAYRELNPGEPAPWFYQRSTSRPHYAFDTAAGRYLVLSLFGSGGEERAQRRLAVVLEHRDWFDDRRMAFFGVSTDPMDEQSGRVSAALPGIRHFWDFDGRVSRLYGALPNQSDGCSPPAYRARWIVLNPSLQVRAVLPFDPEGADIGQLTELLGGLPQLEVFAGIEMHAPVLVLPGILDARFCARLINEYEHLGGNSTGFMCEKDGLTIVAHDAHHKVRRDHVIADESLSREIQIRVVRNVAPAIRQAYQFRVTRMERYLIGCYDSVEGGHFRAHRDNTTQGTAHRRFALSVNLNDDFEGGELVFPEFGPRRYKVPAGAGVVFSCSLLHAVTPIVRGRRYAFLPFLYNDEAAALREANRRFLFYAEPSVAATKTHS